MTDQIQTRSSTTQYLYWNETPFKLYEGENWLVIQNGKNNDVDDDQDHDGNHQTLQILPLREMLKNGKRHCLCPATNDTFLCFEVCNENEIVTTTVKNMLLPNRIDHEHTEDDDDDDDDHGYLAYIANDKNSQSMIYLERRAPSKQLRDGDRIIIRSCEDPTDASLNVEYRMREELDDTRSTPNEHHHGMETNSNHADCSSRMDEDGSNNDDVDERNNNHATAPAEYSQLTEGTSSSSYSYIDEVIETQQQQQQLQHYQHPVQTQSGIMELLTQPDQEQTETFNGELDTHKNSFATETDETAAQMQEESTDGDAKQSTSTKEQYSHKQGQDCQNEQTENKERESDDDSTVDPSEQKLQTQTSSTKASSSKTCRNKPKILSERVVVHSVSAKSNMDDENVPLVVTTTAPKTPRQHESTSAMKSAASTDLISPDLLNDSIDDDDVDEEEEDIQHATRTMCDVKRKLDVSDDGKKINYSQNILDDVSNTGNSGTLEFTKTSEIEHSIDDKKDDVQVSSIQIQENNQARKLDEIHENTNASISTDVHAGVTDAAIRVAKSAENEDVERETAGSMSAHDTSKQGCGAENLDLTVGPMASDAGYQNDHGAGKSPSEQPTEDEQNFASKPSRSASSMEDLADRSMVKFDGGKTVANPKPVHSVDDSKNTLQAEALPVDRINESNSGSSTVVGQKKISRKRKANTTKMDTTPKKSKATFQSSRNNNRMKDIQSADERFDEDSTYGQTLNEQAQGELRILVTGFDLDSKQEKMVKAIGGTLIQDIKYAHTATHVIACDGKSKIRRTPKLMIAMSVTPNIVTLEWLSRSAPKKAPLPCDKYLLRDKEFEKTYDFSMEKSCKKIKSRVSKGERLLDGWSVYVCPGVSGNKAPPTSELKLIVEAAGGSWLTKLESNSKLSYDKTLIITSDPPTGKQETAKSVERAVHKGAKKRTTSWLFRTTITQELDI